MISRVDRAALHTCQNIITKTISKFQKDFRYKPPTLLIKELDPELTIVGRQYSKGQERVAFYERTQEGGLRSIVEPVYDDTDHLVPEGYPDIPLFSAEHSEVHRGI